MASTRDQVEAYSFAARRQVLALLHGEELVTVDPRRRLNRSVIAGLLVGVVALAAVGVAGFLKGGSSTTVPTEGVIIDSSTGGAYVLIDHVLHPALNLASAKLIAGRQTTTVASSALRSLPRGLPVGIPDAPDSVPQRSQLTRSSWSVCDIAPQASAARPQVVVSIGTTRPASVPGGAGVVAQAEDGTTWLLVDGMRYQVDSDVSTLLGLERVAPVPVRSEVLDLVPAGTPLAIPTIPGNGEQPSVHLAFDAVVGDLVRVPSTDQRYVVLRDGLAPVNAFTFALLAGGAKATLSQPASAVVGGASKTRPQIPVLWPQQALTRLIARPAANEPLCVTYTPGRPNTTAAAWPVTISEPAKVPLATHASAVAPASGSLPTVATGVAVPSGSGVLARASATGGVDTTYTLVTDTGIRYSISSADAVGRLGYTTGAAVIVPKPFLSLLPAGPGLDPTAAAAEYAGAAQAPVATATPSSAATSGS